MGVKARTWWVAAAVLVAAAVGAVVVVSLVRSRHQWTTSSPQALAEFEKGIDANMKLYHREAVTHFRRAATLDPDFVMAHVMLLQLTGSSDPEKTMKELRTLASSADLSKLTPRERFLIRYLGERLDDNTKDAEELLDTYLKRHPRDPYALNLKANILWRTGHLAEARSAFEQLVKISPNWVVGYNSLGYIAMEQGDFAESEENFSTYKFIAPDQANPFDSLGELYLLTGRYDEAIGQFQGAIRIKHDFCASWQHLEGAYLYKGDLDAARKLLERMESEEVCSGGARRALSCTVELFRDAVAHRWQELLKRARATGCIRQRGVDHDVLMLHRAAAMGGDLDLGGEIEEKWGELAGRSEASELSAIARILLVHGDGVRSVAEGKYSKAMDAFRKVNGLLRLRGSGEGLLKLFNLACLAEVEGAAGDRAAEKTTVAKIRKVNPTMASDYESGRLRPFGLGDGAENR